VLPNGLEVVEVHPYVPTFCLLSGGTVANGQSGVTLKYAEASNTPDLAEFEQFIPVRLIEIN